MNEITPKYAMWNPATRATVLEFDDGDEELSGEYHIRGGLCWPRQVMSGGAIKMRGFACVACFDVHTRAIHIMAECSFATVDNVIDHEHRTIYQGLAPWIGRVWNSLRAQRYFYRESQEIMRQYWLQLKRSDMTTVEPVFREAIWDDDMVARQTIWDMLQQRTLHIDADSDLMRAIVSAKVQPDSLHIGPEIHSLTCVLRGLQDSPYRQPPSDESIVVV